MRAERWNSSAKEAFSLHSYLTSIVGLWPSLDDSFFLKFRVGMTALHSLLAALAAAGGLISSCGDANDAIDSVLIMAMGVVLLSKISVLYFYREHLAVVLSSSYKDWERVEEGKCTTIMLKHARACNLMAKVFYSAGFVTAVIYVANQFLLVNKPTSDPLTANETASRVYIFPGSCIFDGYSELIYYLVVADQAVQIVIMCSTNMGTDTMFVAIVTHLCGQFEVLKLQLAGVGKEKTLQDNREHLGVVIKRHQHLMNLAEKLEMVYSKIIFIQMMMSVALLCVGGISLIASLKQSDLMGVLKASGVMQFMLMQSYIYTYPSDNLANQAEGLMRALYNSRWYELPTSLMKDVVFVMMRINSPPYLTAGKFFYMTRRSYMDVIKTAGSYLSVLRLMLE